MKVEAGTNLIGYLAPFLLSKDNMNEQGAANNFLVSGNNPSGVPVCGLIFDSREVMQVWQYLKYPKFWTFTAQVII